MNNFYTDNPALKFQLSHPLMEKIVVLKERNYRDREKYEDAPENFEDAIDNYDKVLEIVGEIAAELLAVYAEEVDKTGTKMVNNEIIYAKGTQKSHEAMKDAGLYGMSLPRQYDGLNFPYIPYVMAAEMVSRGDTAFANIWGLQDCAETLLEFASDEIKQEFLPKIHKGATCSMDLTEPDAGSDLQSVQLKSTWDENANCWRLNGVKRFITNGDADIKLVLARSEEGTLDGRGLSYFVYDRKHRAISIRRIENKLGIKGSPTAELVFNNAPAQLVGERRLGLIKYVMSLMNGARLGVAAQAVGLSEAAYREAYTYAFQRMQFGKTVAQFPQVYEMLANIRAKTDASRALLYETTRFVDIYKSYSMIAQERPLTPDEKNEMKYYQKYADIYTPLLKLFATEYCNQNCYDALQIHGGSGYMKDYPIERMYRDARITNIYEGTSQMQVVAAIKGVGSGLFLSKIKEYETIEINPEFHDLHNKLISMTVQYEITVAKAIEWGSSSEEYDFNARRMVEMAGNIIMGYLLLIDTCRCVDFKKSATIFIACAQAENSRSADFIKSFNSKLLELFKV
ncbi:MAG: acyl-CoA dehydrogenase family protein [Bacteroidetes bacterium]|nr:acyl-CoA dehydrogenase family protein [Bacteroidota bacterium]MCL1969522.1 acyl-CoA dehydrogenase family protein [Bacteroidota bacterium]MCL1969658.1 acyl-CoA dehydrogenase family protein [Bacteroidota bacterium]